MSVPSSIRCLHTRCPRFEWTERAADRVCDICPAGRGGTNREAEYRPAENETVRSDYTHPRFDEGGRNGEPSFNPFLGQGGQEHEEAYRRNALIAFRRRNDIERAQWDRYYDNRHELMAERAHTGNREFCGCENCATQRRVDMNNRQLAINNHSRAREEEYGVDRHRRRRRSSRSRGGTT